MINNSCYLFVFVVAAVFLESLLELVLVLEFVFVPRVTSEPPFLTVSKTDFRVWRFSFSSSERGEARKACQQGQKGPQ